MMYQAQFRAFTCQWYITQSPWPCDTNIQFGGDMQTHKLIRKSVLKIK